MTIAFQGRGCQIGQGLERRVRERGTDNTDASKQGLSKCNRKDDKLRGIRSRRPRRSPRHLAIRSDTEGIKGDYRLFISNREDFTAQRIAKQYGLKTELILELFGNLQAGAPGSIHPEK